MVPLPRLPWKGKKTGPSLVDRGKDGVKRRLLTEASGLPLAVEVAPANRHDMKLVAATLVQIAGFEPVIMSRRDEKETTKQHKGRARRWVVERTHSGINRFRRLLIRWEKREDTYLAMRHFACGIITGRAALTK